MGSIAQQLQDAFSAAIQRSCGVDADPLIAASQNEQFGDYQANAAMSLAKTLKLKPRDVAQKMIDALEVEHIGTTEIAGPGFINVRLKPEFLADMLKSAAADERLGVPVEAPTQRVVVDYSSPNVAKEMHVGHLRTTIIGDCFVRLLEFLGHTVIRQNHLGDWGTQFGMLISQLEDLPQGQHQELADLTKFYQQARKRYDSDPEFAKRSLDAVVKLQGGDPRYVAMWQEIVESSRHYFDRVYKRLGVLLTRDDERGESFYNPMLAETVQMLQDLGLAEESDGAIVVYTKDLGYESPLIIQKTGGGYLYGTTDLAAIRYRVNELKANRIIIVVGAPQTQHLRQVHDIGKRAGWVGDVVYEHAAFGSVLGEDGKVLKSRAGDNVKLEELLTEAEERAYALVNEKNPDLPEDQKREIARAIGIGSVKYADLSKDRTSDYIFSFDEMIRTDGNTAPYLQYAHARICSIFRKGGIDRATVDPSQLTVETPEELALAKHLLRFSDVIRVVARDLKPHVLCAFLFELSTRFSSFFENCPVLKSDEPVRTSRLALCDIAARTIAKGLDLLGIEHPVQM